MRHLGGRLVGGVALALIGGVGVAACGSSAKTSSSPTTTVAPSTKAAFCAGNIKLDKASVTVVSPAEFLDVLKANTAALDGMANNVPNDPAIGTDAQRFIAAGRTALATNDPGVLQPHSVMAARPRMNAYCGVDGTGNRLPSYFGHGKGAASCNSFITLYRGVRSAPSPEAAVTFLKAHEAEANDLADVGLHRIPELGAETLAPAVRKAIETNDGSVLFTPAVLTAAIHINSYCGVNT